MTSECNHTWNYGKCPPLEPGTISILRGWYRRCDLCSYTEALMGASCGAHLGWSALPNPNWEPNEKVTWMGNLNEEEVLPDFGKVSWSKTV